MGDLTLSYAGTNNSDGRGKNASKMSVSYKMGDATITASNDDRDETADAVQSIDVSYKMDAMTASIATDEDSVSKLSASYDLGGGVNAFFVNRSGTDSADAKKDFQAVGINFKF